MQSIVRAEWATNHAISQRKIEFRVKSQQKVDANTLEAGALEHIIWLPAERVVYCRQPVLL